MNAARPQQSKNDSENNNFICGVVEGFYGKPWTCLQRRDLFKRLREFKLNAFMYAPKDDIKHRAKWRELYNESEIRELKVLIDEAAANEVDFYYSLSPGLDLIYSNRNETAKLCEKFDQLRRLGCKSFALLFDDIEPNVTNDEDRAVFKNSYAAAQVSVTNLVHDFLDRPNFLFCPTEYCESRAVPNVTESDYLNTIGKGLNAGIDIMWSGPRVVSKLITEESIKILSDVLRRPPVIWENLHANDYDKKRVYLGPYSGRSTRIIPKLRGVLTNPNCEYEANHIAIHTLAQWSRCTEDVNQYNRCNQYETKQQQCSANIAARDVESSTVYDPNRALMIAIRDWLPHVLSNRSLPQDVEVNNKMRNDESASNQLSKEVEIDEEKLLDVEVDENIEMTDAVASRLTPTGKIEMDTSCSSPVEPANVDSSSSVTANLIDTNSCESCEMQDISSTKSNSEQQQQQQGSVNFDDLALLADFYYLPFEHGSQGHAFLVELKWLLENSYIMTPDNNNTSLESSVDEQESKMTDDVKPAELSDRTAGSVRKDNDDTTESSERVGSWIERSARLNEFCHRIDRIVDVFIHDCPNKLVVAELYPYLLELRDMIKLITELIAFLRGRKSCRDQFPHANLPFGAKAKEFAPIDEQEPWVHRGGLIGDIHRLICSS